MGIFSKISNGLKKTKENFSRKIYELFKGRAIDDDFYEELEMALISADVGVTATEMICDKLKDACYEKKLTDTSQAKDILKEIMIGEIDYDIPEYEYPLVILVAGVNGVGKTTAIGKLAKYFKSEGKSVVLAAADTFRAAASDQLTVWAERAGVRIVKQSEGSDPAAVVFDAINSAKARKDDVVLIDTAGRLHNKVGLMNELKKIKDVLKKITPDAPDEVMLVLDGSTGQNAFEQAKQFSAVTQITSLAITKLDGTAKGGVVIGISDQLHVPVKYIGLGEGMEDLQLFNRTQFVDSLFGEEK